MSEICVVTVIIQQQCTGRSSFMPGIPSRETLHKSTQNSHLKYCTSWGFMGLTTSSYMVYDYTTSGHTDLQST